MGEGCTLHGVSKLPFEPKGAKLSEFAKFLWKEGGIKFDPTPSVIKTDDDGIVKLRLYFPYSKTVKLYKDGYVVDGSFKHKIFERFPELEEMKLKRKQKNSDGATYVFES